jgi:hypothetical protein
MSDDPLEIPEDHDPIDPELLALIEWAVDQKREYAGFWNWPDREVAERGIARELLDGIAAGLGGKVRHLSSTGQGNDPPDCVAELDNGALVGIEVTELVDEDHAGGPPMNWATWTPDKFRALVAERITRKDNPAYLKGGPYSKYLLVIHTDEPLLDSFRLREFLDGVSFGPCKLIDAAWILASYEPPDGCPVIPVPLVSR